MSSNHTLIINEERDFKLHELFFSVTDKRGVIRTGNEVFRRISGYAEEELMGKPHSLIRHPDMPRCVFHLFWSFIQQGKPIVAYVKNLAKDGAYYWVMALAVPMSDGYLSIRFKPSSALFHVVQKIYAELLAIEMSALQEGNQKKQGMLAAGARLGEILQENGFRDYDHFMETALAEELKSRDKLLKEQEEGHKSRRNVDYDMVGLLNVVEKFSDIQQHLLTLFLQLDQFLKLNDKLCSKSDFIQSLAKAVKILSLNALIESDQLGDEGRTLGVVAEHMGVRSDKSVETISGLQKSIEGLSSSLRDIVFNIAASRLEIEMIIFFGEELLASASGGNAESTAIGKEQLEILSQSFTRFAEKISLAASTLSNELRTLTLRLRDLSDLLNVLEFTHFSGRVEAARLAEDSTFKTIFEQALKRVTDARAEIQDFFYGIGKIRERTKDIDDMSNGVRGTLREITYQIRGL